MKLETSHSVEPGKFSMAAMSDMAFLLIIFFMVCGHFVEKSSTKVELPLAATGEESDQMPIKVTITEGEAIFVNGLSIPTDQLYNEIKGRVRVAESATDRTVLLRAERSLSYETIDPIVKAVNQGGGMLELAVIQE